MIAQLLNGVALGSLFLLLSSGLALIYGLRGVFNFGHGAMYMLGAYIAYAVASTTSFWLAMIISPLVIALLGVILEFAAFRPLRKRDHLEVGLLTFGIGMMITPIVIWVWGSRTLAVGAPEIIDGTTNLFGVAYPTYRLFIIGVAVVVIGGLVVWLQRSRIGLHIRATSHDHQTAGILGVNTDRVSLVVVALSFALCGLAGTLVAPLQSVSPGMGASIIVTVLIVVVVGGIGSLGGAAIASYGLGIIQTMVSVWVPGLTVLIPFIVLVVVLLVRPTGIAGKRLA
ncbi:branched-chain amino acid ABC transporter permease [Microbacterium pygmaeum]|uniref:Amino acid/amide ABC transporter membrane protein 1, HAAT family n=1 Tax=Microbacterium pygmaeum TaxID=370764 RepID=A0A1G7XFB4_9MICO|nr:branched-chain amino acid ABC transporter permease [Microbacterium pygmaeum]SDG82230.1 amino acid/amide ABC transporter membrane protein 1, HAAT family [Microbacterium pygmaeum]